MNRLRVFKHQEIKQCPICWDRDTKIPMPIGEPTRIYSFRSKPRYCDGAACILVPMSGEHMHVKCNKCGYLWAEELPKLEIPETPPRRSFWEWIADKLGVDCL